MTDKNTKEFILNINSYTDRRIQDTSTAKWTTVISKVDKISSTTPIRIVLDQIEVPNLMGTFPYHSSVLWYEYDVSGADTLHSIDLNAPGDVIYDKPTDIATYITNQFTSNGHAALSLTYNESTKKLTFNNGSAVAVRLVGSHRFSDRLADTYNNIADRLGLVQDTTNNITAAGDALQFFGMPNLLPTHCYYLLLDQISGTKQTISPEDSFGGRRYVKPLARVTANSTGTLSQLQYASTHEAELANNSLDELSFTVVDDEYHEVDLGYQPVTMTLRVIIDNPR